MWRVALGEKMEMIGHQAKGVEQEKVAGRHRNQAAQYDVAERSIGKAGFAPVRTDGDEINAMPEIILRCEPDIFAAEWVMHHRVKVL